MRSSIASALLGSRWARIREQGRTPFVRRFTFWLVGATLVLLAVYSVFVHQLVATMSGPRGFPWGWSYRAGLVLLASFPLGLALGLLAWVINERLYRSLHHDA